MEKGFDNKLQLKALKNSILLEIKKNFCSIILIWDVFWNIICLSFMHFSNEEELKAFQ